MILCGTHPNVGPGFPLQFADEEYQSADPLRQRTLGAANLNDALVDLTQKNARMDHLWGEGFKQFVGGNDRSQGPLGDLGNGVMDATQLRTQLAARAGGIDLAETILPEAPANGQQRVVIDDNGAIVTMTADELILFKEYFTSYQLDESSYKAGFTGLTGDSFTGDEALISGATVSSDAIRVATEDAFTAFAAVNENGGEIG